MPVGAPKGNKNAVGNKGGVGRPSLVDEKLRASVIGKCWDELQDALAGKGYYSDGTVLKCPMCYAKKEIHGPVEKEDYTCYCGGDMKYFGSTNLSAGDRLDLALEIAKKTTPKEVWADVDTQNMKSFLGMLASETEEDEEDDKPKDKQDDRDNSKDDSPTEEKPVEQGVANEESIPDQKQEDAGSDVQAEQSTESLREEPVGEEYNPQV